MPSTNTITTFYDFTAGTKIKSSEVDNNFSIFRGHIIPVHPTSQSPGTSGSYDLGSSDYNWGSVHARGLRLYEVSTGADYVHIQPPTSLTASYTLTLPPDDGSSGQMLTTDGNGVLSWTTPVPSSLTVVTATSATHTPAASDRWHSLTSNAFTITSGTWELIPSGNFSNSGSPAYTSIGIGIYGANGAESSSPPTLLSSVASLTINSSFAAPNGLMTFLRVSGDSHSIITGPIIVTASANVTLFVVTYATMTTPGNARITAHLTARKLY